MTWARHHPILVGIAFVVTLAVLGIVGTIFALAFLAALFVGITIYVLAVLGLRYVPMPKGVWAKIAAAWSIGFIIYAIAKYPYSLAMVVLLIAAAGVYLHWPQKVAAPAADPTPEPIDEWQPTPTPRERDIPVPDPSEAPTDPMWPYRGSDV